MAHIATIVSQTKCTLLEHGKRTVWLWCTSGAGLVTLSRGRETREYRVVEKIADRQYRITLEDSLTVGV